MRFQRLVGALPPPGAFEAPGKQLRLLAPRIVISALRLWFDGWPTARRYQRDPRPCAFGCPIEKGDDLAHYIACPRLWHMVKVTTTEPAPPASPAERLLCGFPRVEPHRIAQLALTTKVYHVITRDPDLADRIWQAVRDRDLRTSAALTAREMQAAASDFKESLGKPFMKSLAWLRMEIVNSL